MGITRTVVGSLLLLATLFNGMRVNAGLLRSWSHQDISSQHQGVHHELLDVKEYAHQQGFEATLRILSYSHNETFGADINPLRLIVRRVLILGIAK
jgi:hypothetical protein